MFVIIGLAIVFGSIVVGFILEGGQIGALMQITEFLIIGGAALGSMLAGNPLPVVITTLKSVLGVLKGNPFTKARYLELLKMLYEMFNMARKDGMVSLEPHVEKPGESKFFANYGFFCSQHHALDFLADTIKIIVTGTVQAHDLAEMMDVDLEVGHEEALRPSRVLQTVGDSMPGFGIVAAVLGVVITMGAIGGPPEQIGHKVGAALVGTFIGILLAYGVFAPLASSLAAQASAESQYMQCIKFALLSFARGDSPMTAVEFARRNIEPSSRPGFVEMEGALKGGGRMAQAA